MFKKKSCEKYTVYYRQGHSVTQFCVLPTNPRICGNKSKSFSYALTGFLAIILNNTWKLNVISQNTKQL